MAENAACLVDNGLAHVPVRQWVLSVPILLRTRPLRRLGHLIEEAGTVYLARTDNADLDNVLTPLQAAASP